jgi:uncharacterized delta-60 repeat protein
VRIGPAGRIIVAGRAADAPGSSYAVAVRYHVNGTLDTTLAGQGFVAINPNPPPMGGVEVNDLLVDGVGRLVLGGFTSNMPWKFEVVRLNHAGALDGSFSGDGVQITPPPTGQQEGVGLAFAPDGKIVLGGNYFVQQASGTEYGIGVARYNTDGSLDTTFSGDGMVQSLSAAIDLLVTDIAVDGSGRPIVVARSHLP